MRNNLEIGRHVFVVLAIVAALGMVGGGVTAEAQSPLISVYPESTTVAHGSTFTLEIRVSSETVELMGYNIGVTFNGSLIQLQSVDEGSLPLTSGFMTFFHWLNPGLPTDSVHVNGAILGNTVDGPGVLFTLTFKGHSPATNMSTDVDIVFSLIRDGINQDITHTVAHGWVEVQPPIAVESVSWGWVKSRYR